MIEALNYFTDNEERVYIGSCFLMVREILKKDYKNQKCKNTFFKIMKYKEYDKEAVHLIVKGGSKLTLVQDRWRLTNMEPERYDWKRMTWNFILKYDKVIAGVAVGGALAIAGAVSGRQDLFDMGLEIS